LGEGGKEFGTGSCGAQIKQREKSGSSEFLTLTCQDFARRVKALPTLHWRLAGTLLVLTGQSHFNDLTILINAGPPPLFPFPKSKPQMTLFESRNRTRLSLNAPGNQKPRPKERTEPRT
jgi:hypothetical protein